MGLFISSSPYFFPTCRICIAGIPSVLFHGQETTNNCIYGKVAFQLAYQYVEVRTIIKTGEAPARGNDAKRKDHLKERQNDCFLESIWFDKGLRIPKAALFHRWSNSLFSTQYSIQKYKHKEKGLPLPEQHYCIVPVDEPVTVEIKRCYRFISYARCTNPKCDHPKCRAKMQRLYKRGNSTFVPCAWMCTDCGQFKKD
jgi:hypothetical protein